MNAIGYAHYQLYGGTRHLIRWTLGVAILGSVVLAFWVRWQGGGGLAAAASIGRMPLTIAVGVLLVIIVNIRIGAAIKRDVTLDMSRSHRLMPQSAPSAVLGYIFGPSLAVFGAAGAVVLIGLVCIVGGDGNPAAWLMSMLILAIFGAMTWCFTASSNLAASGKKEAVNAGPMRWLIWVLFAPMFGTGGALLSLVPFAAVIAGPLIGRTVFSIRRPDQITWAHAVSALLQLALAAIFFIAATRRYRRDDVAPMNVPLWLAMTGVMVAGTLVGLSDFEAFRPQFFERAQALPNVAIPALLTIFLLMLPGLLGVADAQRIAWRYRVNVQDRYASESRPWLTSEWVLLAFILVCAPLALVGPEVPDRHGLPQAPLPVLESWLWRDAWLLTAASFICGGVFVWGLVRTLTKLDQGRLTAWIMYGVWIIPVVLAAVWGYQQDGTFNQMVNPVLSFSSPGAIWAAWNLPGSLESGPFWPGVGFQALVALTACLVAWQVPEPASQPASRE